jgi:hypothetical protein
MQIASSLVTLLGSEMEVQYITLRCVHSLLRSYKEELQRHLQVRPPQIVLLNFVNFVFVGFLLQI